MRKIMTTVMAALIAATSFTTLGFTSAEAQPRHSNDQNWAGYVGPRAGYVPPRYGNSQRYYGGQRYYGPRYHHRGPNWGAVAAGSVLGLAAGAAIAGSARSNDAVAYCEQRFRSYDRASGTYMGYDGRRHACP